MDTIYKPFICITLGIIAINTTVFLHFYKRYYFLIKKIDMENNSDENKQKYFNTIELTAGNCILADNTKITDKYDIISQQMTDKFIPTLEKIADGIEQIQNNTSEGFCIVDSK